VATIIDELVLAFSLDASQFTRGQQQVIDSARKMEDEAQRAGRETESSSKKMGELFTGLKREALGFLGVAVGGVEAKRFLDFIVNLDATTSRLSRTLGINVQDLSAWQNAAKTVGGSGQEVVSTIMRLEQEVWNFRFGAGSNLPGQLRALGINVFDQNNQPKTGVELLRDMASAVDRMQMSTAGKAAFLRLLGLDETTINLIIRGRTELDKTLETMRKIGGTTEESGKEAEKFQKDLAQVEVAATSLGRALAGPLLSGLTWVIDKFREWRKVVSPSGGAAGEAGGIDVPGVGWVPGLGSGSASSPQANAMATLAAAMRGNAGGSANWTNFLSGLSYLETSQGGGGNASSTAQGYFQFLAGTAAKARGQGIADPRSGSYSDQAAATRAYIERNYPQAAAAISRGDFAAAIAALNQEWPSLPGGSQPQSASRYAVFGQELHGGGPRPPGGVNITVQNLTVNSRADNAAGIARDIKSELTRSDFVAQAPQGQQ
jgi:hypothetical protein